MNPNEFEANAIVDVLNEKGEWRINYGTIVCKNKEICMIQEHGKNFAKMYKRNEVRLTEKK